MNLMKKLPTQGVAKSLSPCKITYTFSTLHIPSIQTYSTKL